MVDLSSPSSRRAAITASSRILLMPRMAPVVPDLGPSAAGERLGHFGEAVVEVVLGGAVAHVCMVTHPTVVVKYSNDYLTKTNGRGHNVSGLDPGGDR